MNCCICHQDLPEDAFTWRNKEKKERQRFCRPCKSEYNRRWYIKHAEEQKLRTRKNAAIFNAERVRLITELKSGPCTDCDRTYPPECMDFDHVRGKKVSNVSIMMKHKLTTLLSEIEKCELVCSNCHRIRTTRRRSQMDKAAVS